MITSRYDLIASIICAILLMIAILGLENKKLRFIGTISSLILFTASVANYQSYVWRGYPRYDAPPGDYLVLNYEAVKCVHIIEEGNEIEGCTSLLIYDQRLKNTISLIVANRELHLICNDKINKPLFVVTNNKMYFIYPASIKEFMDDSIPDKKWLLNKFENALKLST